MTERTKIKYLMKLRVLNHRVTQNFKGVRGFDIFDGLQLHSQNFFTLSKNKYLIPIGEKEVISRTEMPFGFPNLSGSLSLKMLSTISKLASQYIWYPCAVESILNECTVLCTHTFKNTLIH